MINTLDELQKDWGKFGEKTWPNATLDSIASHFREEAFEFAGGDRAVPDKEGVFRGTMKYTPPSHDPVEAADCLLLLLSHAAKAGYSLFGEAMDKVRINKARDWDSTDEGGHGHFKHT